MVMRLGDVRVYGAMVAGDARREGECSGTKANFHKA